MRRNNYSLFVTTGFIVQTLLFGILNSGCSSQTPVTEPVVDGEITLVSSLSLGRIADIGVSSSALGKEKRFPNNTAVLEIIANEEMIYRQALTADDSTHLLPVFRLKKDTSFEFIVTLKDPVSNQLLFEQDTTVASFSDTLEMVFSPKAVGSVLNIIITSVETSIDSLFLSVDENELAAEVNKTLSLPFHFNIPFPVVLEVFAEDGSVWSFADTLVLENVDTTVTIVLLRNGTYLNSSVQIEKLQAPFIELRLLDYLPSEPELVIIEQNELDIYFALASDLPADNFKVEALEKRGGGWYAYPAIVNYIRPLFDKNGICHYTMGYYQGGDIGDFRFVLHDKIGNKYNTISVTVTR